MRKRKKVNQFARVYSYGEFLKLFPYCTEEHQKELLSRLDKAKKPVVFAGKPVPDNLNLVSYGLLDDLANIANEKNGDPMAKAIAAIMEIRQSAVYRENVFDVFGLSTWIADEIKRINDLFASISPNYTSEELAAGVRRLNFGSFGVLDWYSHRQGIQDQNDVRNVAWVRIFTCMKQDNEKAEFEKRLNRVYQQKIKSNGKR